MDWRAFHGHGTDRGEAFYGTALEYGQFLWIEGKVARAILCLDRAMGADLRGDEAVLASWPMPYAALAWVLAHTPDAVFTGNPRVHFQHFADRMNAPRRAQRQARAWACWALTRRVRPDLPGDPRHHVEEPSSARILTALEQHGLAGEAAQWQQVLQGCSERRAP
jgi:hypothetical protein